MLTAGFASSYLCETRSIEDSLQHSNAFWSYSLLDSSSAET
jgi:hypothetical protein